MKPFRLSREQLLNDLYTAYYAARRHKRWKPYQVQFEQCLDENLYALCHELYTRTYRPRPSTCFLIADPKRREVFAADFRDRIVHHLYYNYVHTLFERTFIADTYSCIKGRGTHYGINRMEHHIVSESRGYTRRCYVLKIDIRGYFMHIDRSRLLHFALDTLRTMSSHRISRHGSERWGEEIDMEFVCYLTHELVMLDPIEDCRRIGRIEDWDTLPESKSLFHSPPGCGLPIGNLTSQLFSNVYLNAFDQYMKRTLRLRHYGRYVDDAFVVSTDRALLHQVLPQAQMFLSERLGLILHEGKVSISEVHQGVEFLGAYLKPGRRYVRHSTLGRMERKLGRLEYDNDILHLSSSLNSYLGVLRHFRSRHIQRRLFFSLNRPWLCGRYVRTATGYKYVPDAAWR